MCVHMMDVILYRTRIFYLQRNTLLHITKGFSYMYSNIEISFTLLGHFSQQVIEQEMAILITYPVLNALFEIVLVDSSNIKKI